MPVSENQYVSLLYCCDQHVSHPSLTDTNNTDFSPQIIPIRQKVSDPPPQSLTIIVGILVKPFRVGLSVQFVLLNRGWRWYFSGPGYWYRVYQGKVDEGGILAARVTDIAFIKVKLVSFYKDLGSYSVTTRPPSNQIHLPTFSRNWMHTVSWILFYRKVSMFTCEFWPILFNQPKSVSILEDQEYLLL